MGNGDRYHRWTEVVRERHIRKEDMRSEDKTSKIRGLGMNWSTLGKCWTTPSRRKKREESDKERGHRTGGWDVRSEVWG